MKSVRGLRVGRKLTGMFGCGGEEEGERHHSSEFQTAEPCREAGTPDLSPTGSAGHWADSGSHAAGSTATSTPIASANAPDATG